MSGKAAGKKRNRAAQSEQHGYYENPSDLAGKKGGKPRKESHNSGSEKQRTIEKLQDLERRRRDRQG